MGISIIFIFYRSNKLKREHKLNIQKFLEVYRACKPSRYSYVAVQILDDFKGNGEEFINEVGTMGMIHHENVVCLLGICVDGYKRALTYEFLPNESLDKFIFSAFCNNQSLSWHKLQDIAIGIAKCDAPIPGCLVDNPSTCGIPVSHIMRHVHE